MRPLARRHHHHAPCASIITLRPRPRLRPLASSAAIAACVGKLVSNVATYPLETCKMLCQMGKPLPRLPSEWPRLYKGYSLFLPYCLLHAAVQYHTFFHMQAAIHSGLPWLASEAALLGATLVTSLLTTLYKTPVQFYLRNVAVQSGHRLADLFRERHLLRNTYAIMVADDVQDQFIKFALNAKLMHALGATLSPCAVSVLVGVATCILTTPMDALKTRVLCGGRDSGSDSGIRFRLAANLLGTALFFAIFNTRCLAAIA